MWKEKFRTGIDIIDAQHKELFDKAGVLLAGAGECVESNRENCIATVLFLKNYSISHFAYEEEFMQSVDYEDFAEHKVQHEKFMQSVLFYEQKMMESDFDQRYVKEFIGMLATWLIYHVSDVDMRYVRHISGDRVGETPPESGVAQVSAASGGRRHADMVRSGVSSTLAMMAGLEDDSFSVVDCLDADEGDSMSIEVGLTGDISGYITYVYPKEFVKNLIFSLMNYMPAEIGELEMSALYELSNIMSGNICGQMSKIENKLCDIKPPTLLDMNAFEPDERIYLNTGIGVIQTDITVDYEAA